VIVLDTSVLVEGLGAGGSMRHALRDALVARQRILLPTLVLYEWLRGPRVQAELDAQEALFPAAEALPFGLAEARITADLYRELPRPRGREVDLAIAACALSHDAMLWTLNPNDFRDVPGLRLWE
jgi:predicted nucleic acid-binding protein